MPPQQQTTQLANVEVGPRGLTLNSFSDYMAMAKCIVQSQLAPKGMDTPEKVIIAIQLGAEVGLSPMAAVQNIAVINGRPSIWGDGLLALCRAHPLFDNDSFKEYMEGSGDNMEAVCIVRRKDTAEVTERRFSVADAKKARLWSKDGTWQTYPQRMMQMRARSWALRDTFPEALKGIVAREEAEDVPAAQILMPPKRKSTTIDQVVVTKPPEEEPSAPEPTPAYISKEQRQEMWNLIRQHKVPEDHMREMITSHNLISTDQITVELYDEIINWIKSYEVPATPTKEEQAKLEY